MSPSTLLSDIAARIQAEEIITLACRLVEKETVNPPGNEWRVADIVIEALDRVGARIEKHESMEGRPNLLGYLGEGHPVIAIVCHMDVVPAGEGWNSNPFSPEVRDGRIWGRGAVDNKGPFAACWAAVKALKQLGFPRKGTLVLGAVADEETGSDCGMKFLLDNGFKPDYCIIPDGGSMHKAVIGEKGRVQVSLLARGKAAHASRPYAGDNAIYRMADYLTCLRRDGIKGEHHPLFDDATVSVGRIEGGQAPNVVADRCTAVLDIRYPLGMTEEGVLEQLQGIADGCAGSVTVQKNGFFAKPHLLEGDHVLPRTFLDVARELDLPLELATMGGITVGKNLYFGGIPAIVHSPAGEDVSHQANEYVEVESLVTCAQLWAGVMAGLTQ